MFVKSARFYDLIYNFKDYPAETEKIRSLIDTNGKSEGKALLDIACGTGQHISFLKDHFSVEGLDLDQNLLEIARAKNPDVTFHHGNMVSFDLGKQFDAILCLFSSIGYVMSIEGLQKAIAAMNAHLKPGGVLIIEPWLTPERYIPGNIHSRFIDEPDLKIIRMNRTERNGHISTLHFHYMVGTPQRIDYFTEEHELALFTHEEYLDAFVRCGLDVQYDAEGLMNRGLYIGVKPAG